MLTDKKAILEVEKLEEEINKIRLEKEKIELEKVELKKPNFSKPQWLAPFVTILVTVATLLTLWLNGTFDSIKTKTEAEFSLLKLEKKEFEIEKLKLDTQIKNSLQQSWQLMLKNDSLQNDNIQLANIKKKLSSGISEKDKVVIKLIDSIDALNKKISTLRNYDLINTNSGPSKINDQFDNNVSLYPNPTYDHINLRIESRSQRSETYIRIYDESGFVLYHEKFLRTQQLLIRQINISNFPKGKYYVKVDIDSENSKTVTFIKE